MALPLILIPLAETIISVWPLRAGEVSWRFGATGMLSRALMTPMLGLLVLMGAATLLDHRRVLRAISVLSGLAGALIIAAIILFGLDALQMRSRVQPQAMLAFDVASALALAKFGLALVVLGVFAIVGWKASRGEKAPAKTRKEREESLLMRVPAG